MFLIVATVVVKVYVNAVLSLALQVRHSLDIFRIELRKYMNRRTFARLAALEESLRSSASFCF